MEVTMKTNARTELEVEMAELAALAAESIRRAFPEGEPPTLQQIHNDH